MAKVALHLAMLRDYAQKDILGTIKRAGEMGYPAVEFTGYFGAKVSEIQKVLTECGLEAIASHYSINWQDLKNMGKELAREIDYAQQLGIPRIITPWAPLQENPDIDDVNHLISIIEKAALQVNAAGLQFGYHNHVSDLILVNGRTVLDYLMQRIPRELLFLELDLGWVYMAGKSPDELIRTYSGRVPLIHFRDLGRQRKDTEIGNGIVGFDRAFKEAASAGVEYYIVTQEQFGASPIESAELSLLYFKNRGLA
ncbi:sugar phosphate isomerase/epimerase family protein [Paenibacillus sp. GCM10012307]|uniref:Sugar phosphate isomerase/epimerase n=1 Tax=Paenibacillus roseus TaxID=2798579 RepID=A0A934J391_9BACL|nr:sugar phosphate isomerase/epimerase [Paenibacillus roseus]MBJ6360814.1 sugar phosphate isomerase/epimerase [Paenibacillus roseus]